MQRLALSIGSQINDKKHSKLLASQSVPALGNVRRCKFCISTLQVECSLVCKDGSQKQKSSILYLIGLGICLVATFLLIFGLIGSTTTTSAVNGVVTTQLISLGNLALFWLAIGMYVVGGITAFVGYIGALVKMAQLEQWLWFILLLVFSGITMLVYIFVGPETRYGSLPPTYAHSG